MKKYISIAIICMMSVVMIGCHSLTDKALSKVGYQNIDQANQQIQAVRQDAANQISSNNKQMKDEEDKIKQLEIDKEQNASNFLFAAEFAITTIPEPLNRTDLVIDTNIKSASAFLPPPTATSIQNTLIEIKKELNEQITSNADLTKKLQDAQTQAKILSDEQKNAQDVISTLKTSNNQIKEATDSKVNLLQAAKDTVEKNLLSKQQEALDHAEDKKAMDMKLMWGSGILAALCIAASIWLPVFKRQSIEGAVLFGFITVAIPYITPTILLCVGIVIVLAIVAEMGMQHNNAINTIATSTNMPAKIVAKAVSNNTTALLVNDPVSTDTTNKS